MMSDNIITSELEDEIMALQSIYQEDLLIKKNERDNFTTLCMTLYPSTAQNVDTQLVKLHIEFCVPSEYPLVPLKLNFKTSRGLSEKHLQVLQCKMQKYIEENVGRSILFDIIEFGKDSLTSNNLPSSVCPICLLPFQIVDEIFKADCFHHLHSFCLHQYVVHQRNELGIDRIKKSVTSGSSETYSISCPVCRESLTLDINIIQNAAEPIDIKVNIIDIKEMKKSIQSFQEIYDHQKSIGGIIDLEAERKKKLLSSIEESYAAQASTLSNPGTSGSSNLPSEQILENEVEYNDDVKSCINGYRNPLQEYHRSLQSNDRNSNKHNENILHHQTLHQKRTKKTKQKH